MKDRVIRKVGVNVGGLKGLTLSGTQEVYKENKLQIDTFVEGKKHPIHFSLESCIEELRFQVLNVCGLITDETRKGDKVSLIAGCEITSFDFDLSVDGYFRIKAVSRLFDTKNQVICTPKVDSSDGYEFYDTTMSIIKHTLEELQHYVDRTKVISDEELAISYIRHGKGGAVDMEALNEMSPEEKANYIEEISTKLGFLVNVVPMEDEEFEMEEEMIDLDSVVAAEDKVLFAETKEELSIEQEPDLDVEPLVIEQKESFKIKIAVK